MQFDQARIAIHERSWFDNLDLALHAIRSGGSGLLASAVVGMLPAACLNYFLTRASHSNSYDDRSGFWFLSIWLVMIEAPLATAPMTLYLGQSLFDERPKPREIVQGFFRCLPQLILLQGLLRFVLIAPIFPCFIPYGLWPYLNEVILLERNPLVSRGGQLSTIKRNSLLHRGNSGDFFARALGALCLAPLLITALWVTQNFLLRTIFGYQLGETGQVVAAQVVLWIVVAYFTVARFLSYLDQRIRNEGWEVELLLRAQRDWLTRQVA